VLVSVDMEAMQSFQYSQGTERVGVVWLKRFQPRQKTRKGCNTMLPYHIFLGYEYLTLCRLKVAKAVISEKLLKKSGTARTLLPRRE
jgi:hypothetical protein